MINKSLETEEKEYVGENKLSITERFVLSNLPFFSELGAGKQISFIKLHKKFCPWQQTFGYKPMDLAFFTSEMQKLRIKHTTWFAPKGNQGLIVQQALLDKYAPEEQEIFSSGGIDELASNVIHIAKRERNNSLKGLNKYGENTND